MNENILETIRRDDFSFPALARHFPELLSLKQIPQNKAYHAEGDVYRHTEMVCDALKNLPEWQDLPHGEQELLFLAAAFHDIGKKTCTRWEGKSLVSPKHTVAGAKQFRQMAYRQAGRFGLTFAQREWVANAIRFHGLPVWFWKKERPDAALIKAAESIPLRLLYLLSKADVLGRLTEGANELVGHVEWFAEYAKECAVWERPYSFANPYTKAQYFARDDLWQGSALYDDTEFDVFLLSGLPLAGKDTWIAEHGGNMPVISLDDIREEMKLAPAKDSARVARAGTERAKGYLSRKQPFVWNATNIVPETRMRLIRLFSGYRARVHILYLEAPYGELLARNHVRTRHIPEDVLEDMIRKLDVPAPWEAYEVRHMAHGGNMLPPPDFAVVQRENPFKTKPQ